MLEKNFAIMLWQPILTQTAFTIRMLKLIQHFSSALNVFLFLSVPAFKIDNKNFNSNL